MNEPYYTDDAVTLFHGDCLDILRDLPDNSVDSVVTDPPYGLGFMGKAWDNPDQAAAARPRADETFKTNAFSRSRAEFGGASYGGNHRVEMRAFQDWCQEWSVECLRVLKPGGHMLAFGGSRTWHRLACAVEDAGFEIRDSIAWLYGSGFPKSLDVSKAIDKAEGHWRGKAGAVTSENSSMSAPNYERTAKGDPVTAAAAWEGWGTALKPAFEPIVVARKPLTGTVASNVLTHGTGALNIDATRTATKENLNGGAYAGKGGRKVSASLNPSGMNVPGATAHGGYEQPDGRWPTNVVLDTSQADDLDQQTGVTQSRVGKPRGAANGEGWGMTATGTEYADTGGASRFFPTFHYEPKAPTHERPRDGLTAHPTVKPLDLMRWLVRLVTPPGGVVLEPFAGSGTTAEACVIEHFKCIAIERETTYLPLIVKRLTKDIQVGLDFGEGA